MGLELMYKNALGEVVMRGDSSTDIRVLQIEGLGPSENEYISAVYTGYDGQETISQRKLPRCITASLEFCSKNSGTLKNALKVLSKSGTLFIKTDELDRCIYCSQVQIPDVKRVLKGQIFTFAVQFVCDSPYFEDAEATVVPLYKREKLLSSPFTLPGKFGRIVIGAGVVVSGDENVEPVISISFGETIDESEMIEIENITTGKRILLNYAPLENEIITIDVGRRKIESSISGNIIETLSDDTFLGDFALLKGRNFLNVNAGDVGTGFTIECRYSNLYDEAVLI